MGVANAQTVLQTQELESTHLRRPQDSARKEALPNVLVTFLVCPISGEVLNDEAKHSSDITRVGTHPR
jgi:hypothetical protein